MNPYQPDPLDDVENMPALPAGEMPDMDDPLPDEPSGPPTATNDPFGSAAPRSFPAALPPVPPPVRPPRP